MSVSKVCKFHIEKTESDSLDLMKNQSSNKKKYVWN